MHAPWRYYLDFVTLPVVGVAAAWAYGAPLVGVLAGLVLFTFVEYWTHRLVLHVFFWSAFHQRHHQHAAEYVVFPLWYTPAILLASWALLPATWLAGWVLGMVWFYAWHHVLHHWDLNAKTLRPWAPEPTWLHPWLRSYAEWHELHHMDLAANYGITQPFWELVFGSYLTREEGRKALMERALCSRKP